MSEPETVQDWAGEVAFIRAGLEDYHASGRLGNAEWSALWRVTDACERALRPIPDGHRAVFARGMLGCLAGIWRDRPGYDPAWETDPLPALTWLDRLMPEPPSVTCPRCGRTSWNGNDVREGYCGHCHDWTSGDDPTASTRSR